MQRDYFMHHRATANTILSVLGSTTDLWFVYHISRENENHAAKPRVRSKKDKRSRSDLAMPEVPVGGSVELLGEFGDFQIPEVLYSPQINLDVEFMDTQTSLNQARVEDITLLEDNINLHSGSNLTFGEELVPTNLDFFQEANLTDLTVHELLFQNTENRKAGSSKCYRPTEEIYAPSPKRAKAVINEISEMTDNLQEQARPNDKTIFELPLELDQTDQQKETILLDLPSTLTGQQNEMLRTEQPEMMELMVLDLPNVEPSTTSHELRKSHELQLETAIEEQHRQQQVDVPIIVPQVELDLLPIAEYQPIRIQRHVPKKKLLIDQVKRLTTDDLRWNMDHGDDTLIPASARLAEPASRTQTQHLVSRCVSCILTLPGSTGTMLSRVLCDFWCRHRAYVEQNLHTVGDDLDPYNQPKQVDEGFTSKPRLTEITESSIEQERGRQNTLILGQSSSILGSSNLDITVNPNASASDSMILSKTAMPEEGVLPVDAPVNEPISQLPIQTDFPLSRTEMTTLPPLPEEQEELHKELIISKVVEKNPAEKTTPAPILYPSADHLWKLLEALLNDQKSVELGTLCPDGTSKLDAARVFSAVLVFAKKKLVRISQLQPYGPIHLESY